MPTKAIEVPVRNSNSVLHVPPPLTETASLPWASASGMPVLKKVGPPYPPRSPQEDRSVKVSFITTTMEGCSWSYWASAAWAAGVSPYVCA